LQLQALCDGVLDACLLIVYESRYRAPDKHEQSWIDRQADKVARGLSALDAAPPALDGKSGSNSEALPHVGQIALACLLGYRDLRFDPSWRKTYPRLHAWHDDFAARVPAFAATKVER
jgi:glutathione S-transferase